MNRWPKRLPISQNEFWSGSYFDGAGFDGAALQEWSAACDAANPVPDKTWLVIPEERPNCSSPHRLQIRSPPGSASHLDDGGTRSCSPQSQPQSGSPEQPQHPAQKPVHKTENGLLHHPTRSLSRDTGGDCNRKKDDQEPCTLGQPDRLQVMLKRNSHVILPGGNR